MSAEHNQDWAVSDTPFRLAFESSRIPSTYQRDWELGRWNRLATIDYTACEADLDAAFLALIVASANQALGDLQRVRECIDFAMARGCSRYTAIQVLTSGIHNVLGRARLVAGQSEAAVEQFRGAVKLGARQGRDSLIAAARQEEQRIQLGLWEVGSERNGRLINAVANNARTNTGSTAPAIATYRNAPRELVESESAPFILLDSKSLPRSGLHYLRKRFAEGLGSRFSFCEWYQEPGCCGKRPCALTGFLQHRRNRHEPTIRVVKSHDFELDDPVYEPTYCLRRVVLVREPIFMLTSWFALDQIEAHREQLEAFGIKTRKLYYSHEPELVDTVYEILEGRFTSPSAQTLNDWLDKRTNYIRRFVEKWVTQESIRSHPYTQVIDYSEIDCYVTSVLEEMGGRSPIAHDEIGVNRSSEGAQSLFSPRHDPFEHKCKPIEDYLRRNADAFRSAAESVTWRM